MPYSTDALNRLVEQYISSAEGKKFLSSQGLSDDFEEMQKIALQLKKDIIEAFVAEVGTRSRYSSDIKANAYLPFGAIDVSTKIVPVSSPKLVGKSGAKQWRITITFSGQALYRPSLYSYKKHAGTGYTITGPGFTDPVGRGVDDIFELFTQGSKNSTKKLYGSWFTPDNTDGYGGWAESGEDVKALFGRHPNDFINRVMARYEAMYPTIEFKWPEKWGYRGH